MEVYGVSIHIRWWQHDSISYYWPRTYFSQFWAC